jgi:LacI family transcriptional regulator
MRPLRDPSPEVHVATIRDVAREAGVSIATVSRVFNQAALVTESTAQHVRTVAARMDYWPNSAARSLITQRTHAIGVLLPDLYGEFFSEVIRGIDLASRRERYQVLVSSTRASADTIVTAVRALRGRIDGLIAMAPDAASTQAVRELATRFPVVLLDPGSMAPECSAISIANFDGAHALVRHLASLGHERIAMLAGPEGNLDAEERRRGYRHALAEANLAWQPALELPGDFSESAGFHAAAALLAMRPRPSAIFAANDYMAIGLLAALREADVRVPQDVAIAGFDDIAIAQYLSPPLTTVRVDACGLGERALQMLVPFARERRPAEPQRETLATTLVVRASCGAAAAATGLAHRPRHRGGRHHDELATSGHDGPKERFAKDA